MLARAVSTLLAPPLCAACAAPCPPGEPICANCRRALATAPGGSADLPGLGPVTWAAPYRGVGRNLVTALKFGHRLPLAPVLARAIAASLGPAPLAAIVPVPAAPSRRRRRGFDPAELIASALAAELGLRRLAPLERGDGPRQVGRRRAERLADPPRVWTVAPVPERLLLVDDVLTTGATLRACAAALRRAGALEVTAGVFARALGDRGAAA
ncbi:MAG: hypothetical protein QOI10_1168 [Solirubrobacterales bacterium]|jgi:predicted amidophosphoribosyltransferase|nr:hypothetical protein [Solirubrobacterales bacterium]